MAHDTQTTSVTDIRDRWPYDFQYIDSDDKFGQYLGVFTDELDELNTTLETLYDERFIESATNQQLRKFGGRVGVTRKSNEDDTEFRFRVLLNHVVAASKGTAEDIEAILTVAFGADALSSITIDSVAGDPITRFFIDSGQLSQIPIGRLRFESLLEKAFPCGTGVEIVTEQTFTFVGENDTAPSYAAGFGQGAWL